MANVLLMFLTAHGIVPLSNQWAVPGVSYCCLLHVNCNNYRISQPCPYNSFGSFQP